ncbi:MAG: hypothetical protein GKR94_01360 [Gammaproteobacteria bacterium]|nr:hypothetical protein [Gammaproteobacteria bacterium]
MGAEHSEVTQLLAKVSRAEALRPETLNTLLTPIIPRVTRTLVRAGVRVAEALAALP